MSWFNISDVPKATLAVKSAWDSVNSTVSGMLEGEYWTNYLDSINPLKVTDQDQCTSWVNSSFGWEILNS